MPKNFAKETLGWLIVLAGFLTEGFAIGGRSLFLVVILIWEQDTEINWSRTELSTLMALVHTFNGLSTPISGYLVDIYRPNRIIAIAIFFLSCCYITTSFIINKWQTYLIYGALTGTSFGAVNLNVFSSAILKLIPIKRKGLAIGIMSSGSTFGQFALVPCFVYFNKLYNWRKCFFVLGILTMTLAFPVLYLLADADYDADDDVKMSKVVDNINTDTYIDLDEGTCTKVQVQVQETTGKTIAGMEEPNLVKVQVNIETDHKEHNPTTFWKDSYTIIQEPKFLLLAMSFFICGITTTGFIESHLGT